MSNWLQLCSVSLCVCVCFMQCFYICNSCHAIYEIAETQNDIGTTRGATTTTTTRTAAQPHWWLVKQKLMSLLSLCVCLCVCALGKGVSWRSSWNRTKQSRRTHTHTLSMLPDYIVLCHTIEIYIYLIAYQVRRFTRCLSPPPAPPPPCLRNDNLLSDFL